jgi:hypothetical protein
MRRHLPRGLLAHRLLRGRDRPLEKDLDAAARALVSGEARRHDARVVEDEQIAGLEQPGQVADLQIAALAVRRVEQQQPAGGPLRERFLRDEVGGKVVIEVA